MRMPLKIFQGKIHASYLPLRSPSRAPLGPITENGLSGLACCVILSSGEELLSGKAGNKGRVGSADCASNLKPHAKRLSRRSKYVGLIGPHGHFFDLFVQLSRVR
jgi:hypothetical protein